VLLIRESKFGKSRLVPLHPSTMRALGEYAALRDHLQPRPNTPSFFVSLTRNRPIYAVVSSTFRRLVDTAGVGADAPSPPRLHDLRHTFAVHRLTEWYRRGADVQRLLHHLSVYLGHAHLAATQVYLSLTPELLHEAGTRFERYARGGDGHA
jgi:integrase/recombinase XerD